MPNWKKPTKARATKSRARAASGRRTSSTKKPSRRAARTSSTPTDVSGMIKMLARASRARQAARAETEPAKVPKQAQPTGTSQVTPVGDVSGSTVCSFWDCHKIIHPEATYCHDHYWEAKEGKVDDCPNCGRGKYVQYDYCLECYNKTPARAAPTRGKYEPERSEAWDKADAGVEEFFVYILKLDGPQGAEFYAGQTRELRERLSEHRDGGTKSTAGRNPKLVWFQVVPTRDRAAEYEVELKKLIHRNPREIRRRVIQFQDLVKEVEF